MHSLGKVYMNSRQCLLCLVYFGSVSILGYCKYVAVLVERHEEYTFFYFGTVHYLLNRLMVMRSWKRMLLFNTIAIMSVNWDADTI